MPRPLTPEELAALGLDAGQTPKARPLTQDELQRLGIAAPPIVGAGETFANRAVNALPGGRTVTDLGAAAVLRAARALGVGSPGIQLTPQAEAEARAAGIQVPEQREALPDFLDAYQRTRDRRELRTAAGEVQNPNAATLGTGAGIGLSLLAPLPKVVPRTPASALSRTRAAAETAGLYGALSGLEGSDAAARGELVQALKDVGAGGVTGAAAGGLLSGAVEGARTAGRRILEGVVRPTPAAQQLRARGVEDLTVGQMAPGSFLGQVEAANTSGAFGGQITAQRAAGADAWRNAVMNEARAPGATGPLAGDWNQRVAQMADEYGNAYGFLRNYRVATPELLGTQGIFDAAASNPAVAATDESRQLVLSFLRNQATQLPRGAGGGVVTADRLQGIRSQIRKQVRDLSSGQPSAQERAQAELLEQAEDGITQFLESQVPAEASDALRAIDARFGANKAVERAVFRAGDKERGAFTPYQLSEAIRSGSNQAAYARGGGGPLRDLARAGRETLDERVPLTGVRAFIVPGSNLPLVKEATGGLSFLANRPGPRAALLGEAPWQQTARQSLDALRQSALARALQTPAQGRFDLQSPGIPAFMGAPQSAFARALSAPVPTGEEEQLAVQRARARALISAQQ